MLAAEVYLLVGITWFVRRLALQIIRWRNGERTPPREGEPVNMTVDVVDGRAHTEVFCKVISSGHLQVHAAHA